MSRPTPEELAAVIAHKLVHADHEPLGTALTVSSGMQAGAVTSDLLRVAVFRARAHAWFALMIDPR